jgi:hypothetical protein
MPKTGPSTPSEGRLACNSCKDKNITIVAKELNLRKIKT